jgi:single-strand DNA-binding protein
MFHVNRVTLLGNVTRDPETHATKAGQRRTVIGLATVRNWTDEAGSRHTEPDYHRLVCFGKLAEFTADRVKKGTPLYVEGRLHTRHFESKNGEAKTGTEIIVDRLVLLSRGSTPTGQPAESNA